MSRKQYGNLLNILTVSKGKLFEAVIFFSKTCAKRSVFDFWDVPKVPGLFETIGGVFMDNRTFGYARVSSREQHEDRQIEALIDYGVSRDNIIVDKCSGKDTEREGYQYLKKQILRSGDTLVIKELDRLSRSKSDIKQELEFFKNHGFTGIAGTQYLSFLLLSAQTE